MSEILRGKLEGLIIGKKHTRFLNFQVFQKSKKDFNISRRFLGCLRCLDGFLDDWMIFQAFDIFFPFVFRNSNTFIRFFENLKLCYKCQRFQRSSRLKIFYDLADFYRFFQRFLQIFSNMHETFLVL